MNLLIDRIELTLDGMSLSDARLLSAELAAALETRLGNDGSDMGAATADDGMPLETALRGRVLVEAIAARLGSVIGVEMRRATAERDATPPNGSTGEATWL